MNSDNKFIQFDAMNNLQIGDYMMIKNYPCKITHKVVSKTGKHGSAKAHVEGKDVFTDKKYIEIYGSSDKVCVPIVKKSSHNVNYIETNNVFIMEDNQIMSDPVEMSLINEDDVAMLKKIIELFEDGEHDCMVGVLFAMGKTRIIQCSLSKK